MLHFLVTTLSVFSVLTPLSHFSGLFHYSYLISSPGFLHYFFFVFYYCCKRASPVLAGQRTSRDVERWREWERGQCRREKMQARGGVEVDYGSAQRVTPAKAAQRNVCICICVSDPMCPSRQQWITFPHHRSIVEALLPRLTVGPHSHLFPYTGLLVSSLLFREPTSPLCCNVGPEFNWAPKARCAIMTQSAFQSFQWLWAIWEGIVRLVITAFKCHHILS